MTHFVKVQLELSDLFIREITADTITYQVREKDTGKLLEAEKTSKIEVATDKIHFDMRFMQPSYFEFVKDLLKH